MKLFTFLIITTIPMHLFAQGIIFDTLNYSIIHVSSNIDLEKNEMIPSRYEVYIDNIHDKKISELKSSNRNDWINLLRNDDKCYDASLLLYFLYSINAEVFTVVDESDWLRCRKEKEIEFWFEFLGNPAKSPDWR